MRSTRRISSITNQKVLDLKPYDREKLKFKNPTMSTGMRPTNNTEASGSNCRILRLLHHYLIIFIHFWNPMTVQDLEWDDFRNQSGPPQPSKTPKIKKCCFTKLQRTVAGLKSENSHLQRQLRRRDAVLNSLEREMSIVQRQQVQAENDWRTVQQQITILIQETECLLRENEELKAITQRQSSSENR